MFVRALASLVLLGSLTFLLTAFAEDPSDKKDPAGIDPQLARQGFRIPEGLQLDLWAAEPLLANPVAFCLDHQGRIYVAETYRLHQGVSDIRGHMSWLDDDLSCRTVEDRLEMMRRRLGKRFANTSVHQEQVRLLQDSEGQGKATRSTVFAEGFSRSQDGIGAGVLARGNEVWYACIPDLWRLRDSKGVGQADERRVLHTGYGVHIGFIGHDLHGLILGPDGKLYFSIGDRGLNVKAGGKHLFYPDTGCVLRCNPDGSELEVFATGLRNPQELAFDKYGNLFTGDNNSDGGDRARWVYLVEGGDSGWRIGYQFEGSQGNRGPWNAEKMWHPPHPGQPAWIIPPIANLGDGPSGLTYYPGVGLEKRYEDHFFLADFRGAANTSGIRSFAVKPKGAGFELTDSHEFLWGVLATDVDFGPDGALYVSDWVHGWGLTGKGRIWKLHDPKRANDPALIQARKVLAKGMQRRSQEELAGLLEHPDMRVRLEAQWALAGRNKEGAKTLMKTARTSKHQLARLHALWGLGQLCRADRSLGTVLLGLIEDADAEVRAQTARLLGEGRFLESVRSLISRLRDDSPRVRFFAAQSLGKLGAAEAFAPLVAMIRDNADRDLYLRHAGVLGLVGTGDKKTLAEAARDSSLAVRRAVVLAYRRLQNPDIVTLLDDPEPEIVAETARAIHDVPIEAAFPRLASLIERRGVSEVVGYRALNAHFRIGKVENAQAVARFAARSSENEGLRIEAIKMLGDWQKAARRDRVLGIYRPLDLDGRASPLEPLRAALGGIFAGPNKLRQEAARVAGELGIREIGPTLYALATDVKGDAQVRVDTLRALAILADRQLERAVRLALRDAHPAVRAEGRRLLLPLAPEEAMTALAQALEKGTMLEKQRAFATLGTSRSSKAEELLGRALDQLLEGKIETAVRLELVEAAEQQGSEKLKQKVAQYEARLAKASVFGRWGDTLEGGNVEEGRRIFLHKAEVSCLRCHKAEGQGTGEVGPDLSNLGATQTREYLLESLLYPSKQIAKGYETVDVVLVTGKTHSGILKAEDASTLKLLTPEGVLITVNKEQIEERRVGKSAMPEDLTKHLTRREVRDLVAYLAQLKAAEKK